MLDEEQSFVTEPQTSPDIHRIAQMVEISN